MANKIKEILNHYILFNYIIHPIKKKYHREEFLKKSKLYIKKYKLSLRRYVKSSN